LLYRLARPLTAGIATLVAMLGFILDESFTSPQIAELTVSESENIVYIRKAGAVGFNGLQEP
jgi:hypothetical protein